MKQPHEMQAGEQETPEFLTSVHIEKAMGGDIDSLDWLVGRFTPVLLGQARYRLGGALRSLYDPEDLVNDVWTVALPKLGSLRREEQGLTVRLLKFLSTILLNRFNNLVRKHITGKPGRENNDATRFGEAALDRLPRDTMGVVTRIVQKEQQSSVTRMLADLDASDRELVILRGIEQNSVKEIAVMLGMGENSVSVKYRRALQKLRDRLPASIFHELRDD